jgi:hypothetical protein
MRSSNALEIDSVRGKALDVCIVGSYEDEPMPLDEYCETYFMELLLPMSLLIFV